MSGNMDENDWKRDLDAVSGAYRGARDARSSPDLAPPASLDDAIRAAARRAVHARPQPLAKSWVRRWTPQLAVAATVVLTVSVAFVAIEEKPELAPAQIGKVVERHVAEPSLAPAPPAAKKDTRIAEARIVEERSPPPPEVRIAPLKEQLARPAPTADLQVSAPSVAGLMKEKKEARVVVAQSPTTSPAEVLVLDAPASSLLPPPPKMLAQNAPAAPPVYAPPAASPAPPPAAVAFKDSAAEIDRLREKTAMAATARADVGASASVSTNIAATGAAQKIAGARAFTSSADVAAPAVSLRAEKADAEKADDDRPGPWMKRLNDLRMQGKIKELREELARFKKRHPNVVLPKQLAELPAE